MTAQGQQGQKAHCGSGKGKNKGCCPKPNKPCAGSTPPQTPPAKP